MEALIHRFRNNKAMKLKLMQFQLADGKPPLSARRPCTTRWSSHLQAAERLHEIAKYVDLVEPQLPSFWTELISLINFLKPFQIATDVLQADNSTLYDVYKVFLKLQQHVSAVKRTDFFCDKRQDILDAILDMWDKHINVYAVVTCAALSFDTHSDVVFRDQKHDAQTWFIDFAAKYALYWSLTDYSEYDQVRRCALTEYSDYLARSGSGFERMEGNLSVLRTGAFEPKKLWLLHAAAAPVISYAAIAVLSIAGSEAGVERTFSVQNLVHSDRRNRLSTAAVEAEMFIRMIESVLAETQNSRGSSIKAPRKRKQTPLTVDMEVEDEQDDEEMPAVAALFQRPVRAEEAAAEGKEEAQPAAAPAAPAPAPSVAAEAVRVLELPQPSPVDPTAAFIEHFVRRHAVHANYKWSGPRMQVLEGEGMAWQPRIPHTTNELVVKVKQYVRAMDEAVVV